MQSCILTGNGGVECRNTMLRDYYSCEGCGRVEGAIKWMGEKKARRIIRAEKNRQRQDPRLNRRRIKQALENTEHEED